MAESPREFEKGDLTKHLLYLAIPLLITNLMQNFFSIFDMFLLGKIGVQAQSAISIIGFILATFWSMTGGLMTGAIAMASRYCGRKDFGLLKKTLINTMFTAYVLTLIYVVLHYIFRDQILQFFGAKGETLVLAKSIFLTCLISILNDSGLFIFFAILRATGYIQRHFYLLFVSIALNTIFEPLFIYGWLGFPHMGLQGAPMARLMSYMVTTFIMIFILTNTKGMLKIELKNIKLDFSFLVDFIKISLPAWAQGLLSNIASLVMLKIAAPYGDNLLAVLGIGSRLDVFVMMLGWAIGGSASVMVGHNLGAGQVKRAEKTIITGLKIYSIFTFACFMIYFNFPAWVMSIFTTNPEVVNYGTQYLQIISPFYLALGVGLLTGAAFNGAGSTNTPMVINVVAFFGFQIPTALLLTRLALIGPKGIFWGIASVFLFQAIAGWIMYKRGGWKEKKI